jgi:uncharacterized protein involved in exopolysaccharide biosynthesis
VERRKTTVDQQKCQQLEKALNEKVYFLNELTRKKSEDDRDMAVLKAEIEKERNKSMADEALIRKLEGILNEKTKLIDGNRQVK